MKNKSDKTHDPKGSSLKIPPLLRHNKILSLGLTLLFAIMLLSLSGYLFYPVPTLLGDFMVNQPPSPEHPLGTDNYGKDMVQVLLFGTQLSLYIGFVAGILGTIIGTLTGLVAGYKGGIIDHMLRSFTDVFIVIPLWPILVFILAVAPGISITGMAVILAVFSWPFTARVIRYQMLTLKERDYVDLAKISGLSQYEILFKEILPNMLPYISVVFVNSILVAMFAEVGLEVIGLGATGANTLGFIFHHAIMNAAVLKGWWWWIVPGTVAITWIFVALFIVTLGLDEIANPKLKKITGQ